MEDRIVKNLDHLTENVEKISDKLATLHNEHVELRTRIESVDPNATPFYKNKTVQAHTGIGATLLTVIGVLTAAPDEPKQAHITVEAAPSAHIVECDPLTEFCED
jgi:hypothetical protein